MCGAHARLAGDRAPTITSAARTSWISSRSSSAISTIRACAGCASREIGISNHLDTLLEAGLTLSGGAQVVMPEELERIRRLQRRLKPLAALARTRSRLARERHRRGAGTGPKHAALDGCDCRTNVHQLRDRRRRPMRHTARERVLRAHAAWPRMTYARMRTPLTMGTARNFGTRLALRGRLVAFIDAEDDRSATSRGARRHDSARGLRGAAASSRLVLEQVSEHANVYEPLGAAEESFAGRPIRRCCPRSPTRCRSAR